MRSQALFRRSRSLLKSPGAAFSRSIFPAASRPGNNSSARPAVYAKRLSSSTAIPPSEPALLESHSDGPPADAKPLSAVPTTEPPPSESPNDGLPDNPVNSASPPEPPEEPEKSKRRVKKEIETPVVELPEGIALEILWRPEFDLEPSNRDALPPPEIFDEALHNLHITLHPQTQHRATYLPPLGPLVEPTLALYCPIEGGEYVIDATVRELGRRTNAEVLVLDAAHLAAGEWGAFGKAANSLQLPRNPLHFRAPQPSTSRTFPEEEDVDSESSSLYNPPQMTVTVLNPAAPFGRSTVSSPSRRTGPPSKIQVFFDTVVNTQSPDESEQNLRPRLIYIRDFPMLAPSSPLWYGPLLQAVRSRRRRSSPRSTSPISHPVTIIFGMTPPLVPKGPNIRAALPNNLNRPRMMPVAANSRQSEAEWSEDEASDRARERRLRERLRRWEKGDGLQDQIPKLSPFTEGEGGGESLPALLTTLLGQVTGPGDSGNRVGSSGESDSTFFRTSVLVPSARSLVEERACRVARRREINELTMRMAVGAVGGVIDKQTAAAGIISPKVEAEISPVSQPIPKKHDMWEDWGNNIEVWPAVRAVADLAVGHAVARVSTETSTRTLAATPVEWQGIAKARAAHRASHSLRRAWMKETSGTSKSAREQDEDEDEDEGNKSEEEVDEVVDRLKDEEDLDPYEQRLLGCIVNPATMPTSFSQVHLPPHTIDSIRTIVSLPLLHPQAFQQGILKEHGMTGCLLFGPPGTGKTLVVRALAKEAGCRMMAVSPSDVMDMYVGEGEKLVKAVFTLARRIAPCVVFLDEIDALFGARVSSRDRASAFSHRGVLTEFMQEMDGLRSSKDDNVIVIGATNRPFDLDDAVLRRLPRRLLVDLPGERERQEILKILLRDETLGADVDTESIAKKTESFSGSDLKHLCVSAALDAVKEHVVVPWSSTSKPISPDAPSGGALVSDAGISPPIDLIETASSTSVAAEGATLSNGKDDVVPPPAVAPRILHLRHFTKALKEISPSSSEVLGTLADLKKWNEEFGEGKINKKRQQVWGKGLFGFTEQVNTKENGRVAPADSQR
ncbi:hypothetical protein K438DRAFT_1663065 [Mycena galopus ATCC 62051]|nr:hypothetical protein K438DRAFT_1663065 [Mycena galopus ATCC 62051]